MLKTKHKIALARMMQALVMPARELFGRGSVSEVTRGGIRWRLDLREGIDFSIWLLGAFEPETVRSYKRIVKAGDVVLDIGANIGAHTLPLAQAVGESGRVIAFEPTDYAFAKLSQHLAMNPVLAPRISCLQVMLEDSDRGSAPTTGLYSSWPLKAEDGLHDLHQGRLMSADGATVRSLDSVMQQLGVQQIACVKLDIDGFECGMLRGARKILSATHPKIIMELAPYALEEQGCSLEELISLLRELGYYLFTLSSGTPLPFDIAYLNRLIPPGSSLNILARVPE